MHIHDHTAQTVSERLNSYVGEVVRLNESYYMVIDCAGKYGWVDLETGHAHLPDTPAELLALVNQADVLDDVVLTIGEDL